MKPFVLLIAVLFAANAAAVTRYVDLNNPNPSAPYLDWATAATNIQDAIDAAGDGDLVLVTNGVYNAGGRTNGVSYLTNRVVVNRPLTLRSVNGPNVTSIEGYQVPGTITGASAIRCVYLTNGATLVGFTITNGSNRGDGTQITEQAGGIFCASSDVVVSNCVIVGNIANGFGQAGGGVCGGTFFNCLFVGNRSSGGGAAFNSALYNCTIVSNSATSLGAGVYGNSFGGMNGFSLDNCILEFNSAPSGGGAAGLGTLNNCLIRSNTATSGNGGGVSAGTLTNCVLVGNRALGSSPNLGMGGGAYFSSLDSCSVSNNTAQRTGGGVEAGNLTGCRITANAASVGGGANRGTLYNCIVSDNTSIASGGGASSNILVNCALTGNAARISGGGSYFSSATNCLLVGNSAASAGGALGGDFWNSILYYNSASANANYLNSTMNYCCATPLPAGTGNISNSPQLVDQYHLSVASPCIGAGTGARGVDLDGEAWQPSPAIGCDEYYSGTATGLLSVTIVSGESNSMTGFATGFAGSLFARITGNASSNLWDFGDGTFATNQPAATHSWAAPGLFTVKVWVYNQDHPNGVSAVKVVQIVDQPVHHVYSGNATPAAPYLSWETAATNIQDAVDVAFGGSSVLVSNGVYGSGGKVAYDGLSNRVAVTKPLAIRSVNGAAYTVIQGTQVTGATNGDGAARCVLLANGASLTGFTLTNGATLTYLSALSKSDQDWRGGGVWCASTNEVISNCVLVGNAAYSGAAGVNAGTLNHCVLSNNIGSSASTLGSGAHASVLNDCVVSGNRAGTHPECAGVTSVIANNCLVISNSTVGAYQSTLNQCEIIGNAGGGANACLLVSCVIKSNSAAGGASASTLRDCEVIGNSAVSGGGINNSSAVNCIISGNSASQSGGGVFATSGPNLSALVDCLISGNSSKDGGGVYGSASRLTNCVVAGNWATNSGGGAAGGATLVNCLVTGNSATNFGGGVAGCTLINGTVLNNSAGGQGGGASMGTLRNSIIYFNNANTFSNTSSAMLNNCCTIPAVPGIGNFTNAPRFIDQLSGNFRLQTNSPCIGTGNNTYISTDKDLDGRARIVGGAVDVGAYEFQGAGVGELTAWLEGYGLPKDGSADFADTDADGMNNWGEWRSDTIPTNALSVLRMVSAVSSPLGANVTWQSVGTRSYWLERATNFGVALPFESIATNVVGVAGAKTYTDPSATNGGPYFYRVGVQ
jgi:hypothetical protein